MSSSANRLMPEPILFALNVLRSFCSQASEGGVQPRGWTLNLIPEAEVFKSANVIRLGFDIAERADIPQAALSVSCIDAAIGLLERAAQIYTDLPSFPELFASTVGICKDLALLPTGLPEVLALLRSNLTLRMPIPELLAKCSLHHHCDEEGSLSLAYLKAT